MLSLWANWLVTKFGLNSLKRYLWPVLYIVKHISMHYVYKSFLFLNVKKKSIIATYYEFYPTFCIIFWKRFCFPIHDLHYIVYKYTCTLYLYVSIVLHLY